jgi:hypothetical protein
MLFACFSANLAYCAVSKKIDQKELAKASLITMPFMENKGQLKDANVLYYSNTFSGRVSVNNDGSISYSLPENRNGKGEWSDLIREQPMGALKKSPLAEKKAIAKVSQFPGRNRKTWAKDISAFEIINMGEIYDGICLKLKARGNNVEKFFYIRPGSDPKKIKVSIDGAQALKVNLEGELEIHTDSSAMRFSKPIAYQMVNGSKIAVDVEYDVKGTSYGFQIANYDREKELIIDPLITAFFFGESEETTEPSCMTTDSEGNIYVGGFSAGSFSIFKLDSRLEKVLSSVLFGDMMDDAEYRIHANIYDIAIDKQNNIYVAGYTETGDFPVTDDAFDQVFEEVDQSSQHDEGFVTKFNSDLNDMIASTFIGAGHDDKAYALAIDKDGNVFVAGETVNPVFQDDEVMPFPTTPDAYDTNPGVYLKTKAFVMKLDSQLHAMLSSTLLGYNGDANENDFLLDDIANELAIDASGNIVVAGVTESVAFPSTQGCADATMKGETEIFISKFDPNLQNLLASTFLGGLSDEKCNALAIDSSNNIYVAGWTKSSDFPVISGNYDTTYNIYEDGFVSKLDSNLTQIISSTFIGGDGADQVCDIFINGDTILLAGGTGSADFPTTQNCHDRSFNGGESDSFYEGDGFITILDNSLSKCTVSTFLGGRSYDHISSILENNGDIVVTGETRSDNFPYVVEKKGYSDTFVCRFNSEEEPSPLPAAGPGRWQSEDSTAIVNSVYLDIDICQDGTFSGISKIYYCNLGLHYCFISDEYSKPKPTSGNIDFKNNDGKISLFEDCKNMPFKIRKQTADRISIDISTDGLCESLDSGLIADIHFKGESESGKCKDTPNPDDTNPDQNPEGSGGGGGGGCFLSSLIGR